MKIFHEAPLCIFDEMQAYTDGDYALVHLLEKDLAYVAKFMEAKGTCRYVILDNSAYELGESFDRGIFASWVDHLQPEMYIAPDKPGGAEETIEAFADWLRDYAFQWTYPKKMGVVQGRTVREVVNCCKQLISLGADVIGVPFLIGKRLEGIEPALNGTLLSLMYLRVQIVKAIQAECWRVPIHLLGVALPQEGLYYDKNDWVVSVDTSNPVLHGMFGTKYHQAGVNEKRPELLADLIHQDVPTRDIERIWYNVDQFRKMWDR